MKKMFMTIMLVLTVLAGVFSQSMDYYDVHKQMSVYADDLSGNKEAIIDFAGGLVDVTKLRLFDDFKKPTFLPFHPWDSSDVLSETENSVVTRVMLWSNIIGIPSAIVFGGTVIYVGFEIVSFSMLWDSGFTDHIDLLDNILTISGITFGVCAAAELVAWLYPNVRNFINYAYNNKLRNFLGLEDYDVSVSMNIDPVRQNYGLSLRCSL